MVRATMALLRGARMLPGADDADRSRASSGVRMSMVGAELEIDSADDDRRRLSDDAVTKNIFLIGEGDFVVGALQLFSTATSGTSQLL